MSTETVLPDPVPLRVGDYVRIAWGIQVHRIARIWTIDRGPYRGCVKAHAVAFVDRPGYRGWAAGWIAPVELFQRFPYAGPDVPLPHVGGVRP
jgi:hypothetical protein